MLAPIQHLPPEWLHRISVVQYHRMIAAGVFDEDARVELLEGAIVEVSPHTVAHARIITKLTRLFVTHAPATLVVRPQLPLTLPPYGEPEPDLAIVAADEEDRNTGHPEHALLVVEVASHSLAKDRGIKAAIYARHGIEEYWIVNVANQRLEAYRDPLPQEERYRTTLVVRGSESLAPLALPGASVVVEELLGGAGGS